jgi:hypothetical protein
MIQGFKAVNEWITPQIASWRSPGVDTWKLGSNGTKPRSAEPMSPSNGPSFLWVAPWWVLGPVLGVRTKLRRFACSGGPFDLCALF